jgi:peptidoglycan-associated lipoprotein
MKKLLLGISILIFVTGCVYKPYREIDEAKALLEEAKKAEADIYAPDEFKSASEFLEKALDEMAKKEYIAAKASALSSKNFSQMAIEKTKAEKEKRAGKGKPSPEAVTAPVIQETPPEEIKSTGEVALGGEEEKEEVILLERIHFDFDDYSLRDDAKEILKKHAQWLKEHPSVRLIIEGHCDERGTSEYNLALGQKRADSAKAYLVQLGIDPSRIETVSFGEEIPLDPGHDESAWAKNRRAEFVVKK